MSKKANKNVSYYFQYYNQKEIENFLFFTKRNSKLLLQKFVKPKGDYNSKKKFIRCNCL